MNRQLILINVSGNDHPGITSNLMKVIVKGAHKIVDMGQSVTHGLLSLSILVDVGKHNDESPLLKDLLFEAKKLGVDLEFEAIENGNTIGNPNAEKFILSCVAKGDLEAGFIQEVAQTLSDHNVNIRRIDNVDPDQFKSLDILTESGEGINWNEVKENLIEISGKYATDIAFLRDNVFRRNKRLIVFDMDSTLIQAEVIVELAKVHGVGDEVHEVTERAMNGELDFNESLSERVSKLKGLEISKMQSILEQLPLTDGVEDVIKTVKSLGYKTAIISGGFNFFAQGLKDKLGMDYAFANELDHQGGKLTGKVNGTIVNAEQKAVLLDLIAQQEKINLEQVVAVGDGANDLPMLSKAGLGIAFHAKPVVREKAEQQMSHGPMTSLLYFLGIPGKNDYSKTV
jgi:phosphoserine phosphatase